MKDMVSKNPLHGITLKMILTDLEKWRGWQEMGENIRIRCFTNDPSINSSLKFLRKTPWARKKVEKYYVRLLEQGYKPGQACA